MSKGLCSIHQEYKKGCRLCDAEFPDMKKHEFWCRNFLGLECNCPAGEKK